MCCIWDIKASPPTEILASLFSDFTLTIYCQTVWSRRWVLNWFFLALSTLEVFLLTPSSLLPRSQTHIFLGSPSVEHCDRPAAFKLVTCLHFPVLLLQHDFDFVFILPGTWWDSWDMDIYFPCFSDVYTICYIPKLTIILVQSGRFLLLLLWIFFLFFHSNPLVFSSKYLTTCLSPGSYLTPG